MTPRLPLLTLTVLSLVLAGCTSPEEAGTPTPGSPTGGTTPPTQTTPTQTTPTNGGTGGGVGGNGTGGGGAGGTGGGADGRSLLDESFESGFVGWRNNTDPAGAGWTFETTTNDSHHGEASLRVAFAGAQPEGAAWISREVQTPGADSTGGGSAGMALNLSVWVRGPASGGDNLTGGGNTGLGNDSAGRYVLLWIGTTEPTSADQFDAANGANAHSGVRIPLREQSGDGVGGTSVGGASDAGGWALYTLEWATPVPANGLLYVAIGVLVEGDGGSTTGSGLTGSGAEFHLDHLMLEFDSMS